MTSRFTGPPVSERDSARVLHRALHDSHRPGPDAGPMIAVWGQPESLAMPSLVRWWLNRKWAFDAYAGYLNRVTFSIMASYALILASLAVSA